MIEYKTKNVIFNDRYTIKYMVCLKALMSGTSCFKINSLVRNYFLLKGII